MKLSAPIYRLKRQARILSREQNVPLHAAQDLIARGEGYGTWSLLAQQASSQSPGERLVHRLAPGDLVLLGARPGHGKTLLGLEILLEAIREGRSAAFFTLEYSRHQLAELFAGVEADIDDFDPLFTFFDADDISADYIAEQLQDATAGTVVLVDFLQALEQKRTHPPLAEQLAVLRRLATSRQLVLICISQIDRQYDPTAKPLPDVTDVRLPNPANLTLFNRTCFMHAGELQLT